MQIEIAAGETRPAIALSCTDDFTSFKIVQAPGLPVGQLEQALTELGRRADDGHAFVSVSALKRLAGCRAEDEKWIAGLEGMLSYARTKGWTDEDGNVRAHLE